ncbi:phytanoyl-CoA dioxygenase [Cryptococcus neoformans C23]|uniref:Phytanoyl-CoA dioxygenase n=2 Tax=Cryptococcus neoformans TaxID=5207 RepID=A0A854QAB4_CRYNE|nr:phytanoyl-CoA dioxygenase [Cryptococcus neoformans var. grubii H99]AUB24985.1 phytanoyl-CoA dioxygenase [Cryptococcus neoformans var. grubii]OWZ31812.1 phytanoyl-CoA dioxygenase [Cryptococcus neoformans var. grubii AD2-60a]OWZ43887.1 phytanoyl-CoA dioxygenase [Cryptococcus neoformans var. grubii C23]OWZ54626.1 phytanoyl-CoA dioxygenase [Cryptococcus neoformans var. grubii 125.91]OWZ78576.1 phytanoyl-CoA dioxygenase [Cryptococcus neoformans var. grubii Bt85]OXC84620.1 phytanoyl-CoA dioxygen|eukprot:XP_012049124.1 phytanoyl-CoA dioxygenase [Cryptococcus neoformans var. grubii H99]
MTKPASLTYLEASTPLVEIYKVIERDGGVIIRNFLSSELLQEAMSSIEPHFAVRGNYESKSTHQELGEDFFPSGSLRIYGLLGKIPQVITKIVRLPTWQGVMARFLNDEYSSYTGEKLIPQKSGYMLASTAALRLVPGAQKQPLHRDQIAYQIRPDPTNPLFTPMVGCLIAGSKCTKKNGATAVIPGSHLWSPDRAPKIEECTYAEMEAGDALFTLGSCYHGAGENQCEKSDPDALRTLFAVFGQRDYFRQDQEEVLSTPLELAKTFPEDILRIAGYYKAVGGVGYVEDHQDPVEFLKAGSNLGQFAPVTNKSYV